MNLDTTSRRWGRASGSILSIVLCTDQVEGLRPIFFWSLSQHRYLVIRLLASGESPVSCLDPYLLDVAHH